MKLETVVGCTAALLTVVCIAGTFYLILGASS